MLESLLFLTSSLVVDHPLFDFFVWIVLGQGPSFLMEELEWRSVDEVLDVVQLLALCGWATKVTFEWCRNLLVDDSGVKEWSVMHARKKL